MIRAQERHSRRRAASTRQALDGFERAISEWRPEPPDGILPWAHRAYLAGLVGARDDLRAELGMAPAARDVPDRGQSGDRDTA